MASERHCRSGLWLALVALATVSFAPFVHGMVHGDHLIEALFEAHHSANPHQPADTHQHQAHCPLYQFCLASAGLAPDAPQIARLADAHVLDHKLPPLSAPQLAIRDLPRSRGPPLA